MAQMIKHLPLAQVMVLGSWNRALRWAPCLAGRLLLPLLLHAAALVAGGRAVFITLLSAA